MSPLLLSSRSWAPRALVATAVFLALYGSVCGRGFLSDDYAWIVHGRVDRLADVAGILDTSIGFYRPLVSLSFGLNYALAGLAPWTFGLTNLAFAFVTGIGVMLLARELRLSAGAAATAAILWLFNPHGINMGILWLSGRTSLLLTLFSLVSAIAFLRGRTWLAPAAVLLAMLCKEEAVLLPLLFTVWYVLLSPSPRLPNWRLNVAPLWLVLAVYLLMRGSAGAMWPGTAPPFYQPTFDATHVARNAFEYADRSAAFAALAVLFTCALLRRTPWQVRVDPILLRMCASWVICAFALTVFLPVRSSLYAVFPSVGVAIAAAAVIGAITETRSPRDQSRLAWIAVAVLILLTPLYAARNERWTSLAELSSSVVSQLHAEARRLPEGTTLAICDDRSTRVNLANAWGGLTPKLSTLAFGGRYRIELAADDGELKRADGVRWFRLSDGALRRIGTADGPGCEGGAE